MFLDNKYTLTYQRLVEKAKTRPLPDRSKSGRRAAYFEEHHILPKALGGADASENYVYFTAREHFIAHLLLPKMTVGNKQVLMKLALSKMLVIPKKMLGLRYIPTGRTFEIAKRASAEAHRGNKEIAAKISLAKTGKKASAATKAILSKSMQAAWDEGRRIMTLEHKAIISAAHKNKPKSEKTCDNMKQAWIARRINKAAGLESRAPYSEEALLNFKIAARRRVLNQQSVVKHFAFGY